MKWHVSLKAWRTIGISAAGTTALVLIMLKLAGFFEERIQSDEKPVESVPGELPPGTSAVAARLVEQRVVEQFPGSVRAIRETLVSARILAQVKDVLVRPGHRVEAGAPLLVLDDRELQARAEQAREALAGARARLKEAEANFQRMKNLLQTNVVTPSEFDSAEALYRSSQAAVDSAIKRLEEAQVNLSYASLEAPFNAVVTDRFVDPGDVASPGVPLLKLYDPSKLRLEAFVRESLAIHLKPGDVVEVSLEALSLRINGKVEEVVPQAHAGSRSFLVKTGLPPREKLYPGMFGRLLLQLEPRKRLLLPREALLSMGQLRFVVLADEGRSRRLIVSGESTPRGEVEILSGLAEGERVLVPPPRR